MKLKFYSRDGHVVRWPGTYAPGQPDRRVGRTFVAAEGRDKPARQIANKDATEIDSEAPEAAHLVRQCQKGGLWPADQVTAEFCGVAFTKLRQDTDGEWVADRSAASPQPKPKAEAS